MAAIYVRGQLIESEIPLNDETVSIQSHQQERGPKQRGRADSAHEIMEQLYTSERPMSRLEIFRSIGRAKSPHLIALLEQMVSDGLITRFSIQRSNGVPIYFYEPNL